MFILLIAIALLLSFIFYGYISCKHAKLDKFIIDKAFDNIKHFEFK